MSLKLYKLGYILYDNIVKSVKLQKPYCLNNPKSQAARNMFALADVLLDNSQGSEDLLGARGFIQRVLSFFGA